MTSKDMRSIFCTPKSTDGASPMGSAVKVKSERRSEKRKRPVGMSRELYNLYAQGLDEETFQALHPGIEKVSVYKTIHESIAFRKVRHWQWTAFVNESRSDNYKFCHWEREDRDPKEPYVFAAFNKVAIVQFSDEDFKRVLKPLTSSWTLEATRHLLELCKRFDLRWPVIVDRFDHVTFNMSPSIEDIKEWYYKLTAAINRDQRVEEPSFFFDAENERRRKEQLEILLNRTEVEVKQEAVLVSQLKTKDPNQKGRDKRAQELQRLIEASERSLTSSDFNDVSTPSSRNRASRRQQKHKTGQLAAHIVASESPTNLRFSEFRSAGPHLRSQEMKLPRNCGVKRIKAIDAAIQQFNLPIIPHAYAEMVAIFNELRTKVVHAQELRVALQQQQ